jgi:GTPase SAR1 family protein
MNANQLKKVVVMGLPTGGKTSMRQILFADMHPKETKMLGATYNEQIVNTTFLNNIFCIADVGGHEDFMKKFLDEQKIQVFTNCSAVIYVIDVSKEIEVDKTLNTKYIKSIIESVIAYSPNAWIFFFLNKIDLISDQIDKKERIEKYHAFFQDIPGYASFEQKKVEVTSIFEASMYAVSHLQ